MSKWFIYTRGVIHPHRLDMAIIAFRQISPLTKLIYSLRQGKFWWAWDDQEIRKLGYQCLKTVSQSKSRDRHFGQIRKNFSRAVQAAEKIRNADLKKLSNSEIIKLYQWLCQEVALSHGYLNCEIDAIDIILEDFLKSKIDPRKYQTLSRPLFNSYLRQEELYLKKYGPQKTLDKFWWTSLGWECVRPRPLKYYQTKRTKSLKNNFSAIKKLRAKESKKIQYWLEVMDLYVAAHDWRKEMQVRTMYSFYLLMAETARRLKLNKDDLEWLFYDEVEKILSGQKINLAEINRRKKHFFLQVDKSKIKTYSGQLAQKKHDQWLKLTQKTVKQFTGTPATSGQVTGQVKVCNGGKEALKKIKKGDILVCGMTLPDYLPAMKRAKALITDEGGITCHAAIVSRELHIPCIVGTKIATQVLKDGDLVEVNANYGTIKIIN